MSEETRKAKSAVPKAMFWSIFMNGCLGFIIVNALLDSMGSIDEAINSASPILTILLNVTGSKGAPTVMIAGLFVISFNVNLASIASQLALIIKTLPPYAIAKLNGDQLEELLISTKVQISTDQYRGVMEEDDAAAQARLRAQQQAAQANTRPAQRTLSV